MQLDKKDLDILDRLQENGRLTNNELAERVALSPSQCSRRRARLEAAGIIRSYHADISRDKLGYQLIAFISVTLSTHDRDSARHFADLIRGMPQVLEAYAVTGNMDYLLKAVTTDLNGLSRLINDNLLPHHSVQHVMTAIVLETLKESRSLPVSGTAPGTSG